MAGISTLCISLLYRAVLPALNFTGLLLLEEEKQNQRELQTLDLVLLYSGRMLIRAVVTSNLMYNGN